jgi:ketosteroid isomerase-like protein
MEDKMKRSICIFLLLILIVATSCIQKANQQAELDAIKKSSLMLIDGLNADDVEAIMSVLTDDHITMAPSLPALDKLGELRKWHEDRIKNFSHRGDFDDKEIQLMGDWAFQRWEGTPTIIPKDGGPAITGKNKGIWIWKRQSSGEWKLARSIWNSDLLPEDEN